MKPVSEKDAAERLSDQFNSDKRDISFILIHIISILLIIIIIMLVIIIFMISSTWLSAVSVRSIEARQDKSQIRWHTFVWCLHHHHHIVSKRKCLFQNLFCLLVRQKHLDFHDSCNILGSVKNTLWFSCQRQLSTKLSFKHLNFHNPLSTFTILLESGVKRIERGGREANQIVKLPTAWQLLLLLLLLITFNYFVAEFPNFCPTKMS